VTTATTDAGSRIRIEESTSRPAVRVFITHTAVHLRRQVHTTLLVGERDDAAARLGSLRQRARQREAEFGNESLPVSRGEREDLNAVARAQLESLWRAFTEDGAR
jgi:hypothetical protein